MEHKTSGPSRLLYVKDIAERLNRSVGQVQYMISTEQLPHTAIIAGRRVMREDDLESWVNSHFEAERAEVSA
ncbi:helix-turn-helix domain-containing protein [Nesterenkonia sp. CF4.4]|uniref:helix-turn-helix domain-containing protein n=1 Tax=Nesterenkonia sp. CF4.4 TaxID=3373079 RepID=UPI003EE4D0DE